MCLILISNTYCALLIIIINFRYGLILPNSNKAKEAALNFRARTLNPLLDSDDELEKDEEEEENAIDWVQKTLKVWN